MAKGKLLGSGRTAQVYEWGPDKVIKLFFDWYPESWIRRDANTESAIFKAGIRCPEVFGVEQVEGQLGIVYERIEGITMLNQGNKQPAKILSFGKEMAKIHYQMHQISAIGIENQKQKTAQRIIASKQISSDYKEKALAYLDQLPDGNRICHGDFHPDNIMETSKGRYIIDWSTASLGNPLSDVARTCLILDSPYLPPELPLLTTILIKTVRKHMKNTYLKHYLKLSKTTKEEVEAWMLPLAIVRLGEGIPAEEQWLTGIINRHLN